MKYEVEHAFSKKLEQKDLVFFPVRIDDAIMDRKTDWAKMIKDSRNIGDFTNWQDPDGFEMVFEKLLQDLRESRKG